MIEIHEVRLAPPAPFLLKAVALSHGWHELAPFSWSEAGQCLQVILRQKDTICRVSVLQIGRSPSRPRLKVILEGRDLTRTTCDPLLANVRTILGFEHDFAEFHDLCARHPELRLLPRIGAGRLLTAPSMTENLVKAVCGTNIAWGQAVRMANRIGQLGPSFRHFQSLSAWPTPIEILKAGPRYLNEVARLGYRTESVLAICRAAQRGPAAKGGSVVKKTAAAPESPLDPESILTMNRNGATTDELRKALISYRGIGPASAAYLLSLLGRHEDLSVDTVTIAHAAEHHFGGRKPTPKEVRAVYEPYGKWKNLVYWFENWTRWDTAKKLLADFA